MPTRISLFSLVAAGLVVAAQGPFTSSLVSDPDSPLPMSTGLTTIFTTVITTVTRIPPPTTIILPPSVITTTLFVSSPSPVTTTVFSSLNPSPSPNDPSNIQGSPMESLVPTPTRHGNVPITQNPGALAGLIIGVCVVVTGLAIFAWFTINRHRLRELEHQASLPPPIGAVRYSTSVSGAPPANGHSGVIGDDPDLEIQSSLGRPSSIGIGHSLTGLLGHGESPEEQPDSELGYFVHDPTFTSSNGQSSHGNGTIMTRTSSLTHVTRNTSPTLSRQNPNRARFSLNGPDRVGMPSAFPRSEAPSRRGSVDDGPYHPHRVNSDPVVFHDAPQLMQMPVYARRQSSEIPRPEMFQLPGLLVHPAPPNLPSSLLGPPSSTQIPTLESLQRPQPSGVYLGLASVDEPVPSPAASDPSILPMRENLLDTPPNHPSSSARSIRDDYDYSRQLAVGVVSPLRDSVNMTDVDSDSELLPNRDSIQRGSTSG